MVEQHARPSNPKQLVDEFKKSGEFDRLRRQLLTHFTSSDDVRPLMSRVEEIAREKLSRDDRLEHKTREAAHAEVMEDMERYPIVERAVADLAILKDETLLKSIEQYARNIVRGESNENAKLWEAKPSRRRSHLQDKDEEDNDASSDYTDDEPDDDELLIITDANRKDAASSRSPEPESGKSTAVGEVMQNGRSPSQLDARSGTRADIASSASLPSTTQTNAANRSPHTPPWPHPQEDIKSSPSLHQSSHPGADSDSHSPVGVPSSDSFAGELLVNGAPAGHAHDMNEGNTLSPKELIPGREERDIRRQSENSTLPELANTTHGDELVVKTEGAGSSSLSQPSRSTHTPPHSPPEISS